MRITRVWTWWQAVRDRRNGLPAPQAATLGNTEEQLVAAVNNRVRAAETQYHRAAEPLLGRLRVRLLQLETIDLPQYRQLVQQAGRMTELVAISRTAHNLLQVCLTAGEVVFNMIVFLVLGESTLLTWIMALAVGLGLPAVAVFFGTDLRQAQWTKHRIAGWTTVLVVVAATLAGINYIRIAYIAQTRDDAFAGNHPGLTVAYFTINTFVFVAATLVAYFGHDPVAGFVKAKMRVEKGRAAVATTRAALNGLARRLRTGVAEWHDTGRVYIGHYRAVNRRGRPEVPRYFDDEGLSANRPAFHTPEVPEFADEEHANDAMLRPDPAAPVRGSSIRDAAGRVSTAAVLLFVLALSSIACGGPKHPPQMVVFFVDGSCSVGDMTPYADTWQRVVSSLESGDRIVLGRVAEGVYTKFRPVVDESLPVASLIVDNALVVARKTTVARAKLAEHFSDIQKEPCSQRTPLLDTLSLAEKVFGHDRRARILVLGSGASTSPDSTQNSNSGCIPPILGRRRILSLSRRSAGPRCSVETGGAECVRGRSISTK